MYFIGSVQMGHLGRKKGYETTAPIVAKDAYTAFEKAKSIPAVKSVCGISETNTEGFIAACVAKIEDPYSVAISRWIIGNLVVAVSNYAGGK
ncbi:MAG TPA: hypothetical protein P5539_10855 [Mesotoga sp.]|nr:hypothetical protein [Mesotoga sp.]